MRVVLADPPAYTPSYDHELAAALARAGAEVELVTSRFRFGEAPEPVGYRRSELFYPASVAPLPPLAAATAREAAGAPARDGAPGAAQGRRRARAVARRSRRWTGTCSAARAPLVFTAHDLLPRRTAAKVDLWRGLFARFARIVVHTERGRAALEELGVASERLRVIPHPVFARDVPRRDDGRTLLFFGVIRAYRGLGDAIDVAARAEARLIVAGDPVEGVVGERGPRRVAPRLSHRGRRSTGHTGTRRWRCSRIALRSTRAARCSAPSAPVCRRSSTTSEAWQSRCGATGRGASSHLVTWPRWPRPSGSSWPTRRRSRQRATEHGAPGRS